MKRALLLMTCVLASMTMLAQVYFPEGTKWTEIRLDTLKYDSWYSKARDEWVPNFETIEYYVKGDYIDKNGGKYKCVYTNGPEWTDSLTLLLQEEGDAEYVEYNNVMMSVLVHGYDGESYVPWPGTAYQFDWNVGKGLYYEDITMSNTTSLVRPCFYYGIINEIKEGYFGGSQSLRYVDLDGKAPANDPNSPIHNIDTKGGRILQGIGITEWNDGECLFGPSNPYSALSMFEDYHWELYPERHYRSMLVHFERNGEVLYNVWPEIVTQKDYRPFVEEGKVWKVGGCGTGNPVQFVEYFYFEGDTIINGKTCKQMMYQEYYGPNYPLYPINLLPNLNYVGAWYEEDQKVYFCNAISSQFKLMYDFSINANDTLEIDNLSYVIGPKQSGGIKGYKGVYRDVMWSGDGEPYYNTTWLEGIGGIDGPIVNVYHGEENHALFLMECYVGDEVIYYNDEYEDGATPDDIAGARKHRIDFTHTTKIKPKTRSEEEQSLYGEYNEQQLSINLSPISDAYQVYITNESGNAVYERVINTGSIVGLNIDISAYAKGHYTVTVENSQESFTGEFETLTNGIKATRINKEGIRTGIYNLQGQRLNSLQKGLNIVDGKKVYVK